MRIELEPVKDKVLEIKKPNGKEIVFKFKKLAYKEYKAMEIEHKKLMENNITGKMCAIDFLFETWNLLIENFNAKDIEDLEFDYLQQIGEAVNKIAFSKDKEDPEEKKNP
jgi:hypothetical protein